MTHEEKIKLLTEWESHHTGLKAIFGSLKVVTGDSPDNELTEKIWKLFDSYTDCVAQKVGDFWGSLSWYCWENDMGKDGKPAGMQDGLRPIKTLEDLLWLIEVVV